MSDFLDLQGAKDLNTDAIHIGAVANSKDPVTGAPIDTHVNRVGGTDYTLQGFWNAVGPVVMPWTSAVGGTLTQPNQAFLHPANGNYYSWGGAYPAGGYVVAPGTDPTPPGSGYVPRTDVVLRNELAGDGGAGMVGGLLPKKTCRTVSDIASAIAISASTGSDCDIYMNGVSIASQIAIPSGIAVRFYGHATVAINDAFVYEVGESNSTFRPVEFVSGSITATSAVHCVRISIPWSSKERCPVIVHDGFEFKLSGGACALRLTGGFFHKIDGIHRLDATSHLIHFDVQSQQVGDKEPVSPMNLTLGCSVVGGNLFKYSKVAGTPFYHAEGVVLTDKFHSYACKIDAKLINGFINNAQLLESASCVIDSCPNSSFSPKYADMVTSGDWMLKVKTSLGSAFNLSIAPEILQSNSATGSQVLFTDEGNPGGFEIYNVSYSAAVQQGGGPAVAVYGVEFNHSSMRNFNADGRQCFSHMAAPYKFVQPITRSSIAKFEARDVGAYAVGISTSFISSWSSYYNRFTSIYDEIDVVFTVPTFIGNGIAEEIMSTRISWPVMQRAPVITQFVSGTFPSVDGPTLAITSYEGGATVSVVKSTAMTSPSRVQWAGVLSLNATAYVAPR